MKIQYPKFRKHNHAQICPCFAALMMKLKRTAVLFYTIIANTFMTQSNSLTFLNLQLGTFELKIKLHLQIRKCYLGK